MNPNDQQMALNRMHELQRAAERERLANEATESSRPLTARVLAPLGRTLVASGTRLMELAEPQPALEHGPSYGR